MVIMVFKDVDFVGFGQWLVDIFVFFLYWRFVVLSVQQLLCWEYIGFFVVGQFQMGCLLFFYKFFLVFGVNLAGYIFGRRVLIVVFIKIVIGVLFIYVDYFEFQGIFVDFMGVKCFIGYVVLIFIVYLNMLVLLVIGIESFEIILKVDFLGIIRYILSGVVFWVVFFVIENQLCQY